MRYDTCIRKTAERVERMIYDVIIIGTGPAGLTAAIYAQRAKLSALVFEKEYVSGGQVVNTYEVDNYPGMPNSSGFEMGMKFREHADALGASFVNGEVDKIENTAGGKKILCKDGTVYETKTVILSGVTPSIVKSAPLFALVAVIAT